MTVNEILTLSRSTTHTTATQFPDATLIGWLNLIYKKLIRKIITEADENYFTTYGEIDAVAAQDSYSLGTTMINLKSVKVKPDSDSTDYNVSREIDFSKQPHDFEYYADGQPSDDYRHQIIANSLWLAPRFTTDTAGTAGNKQIYYTYESTQTDLATGGSEASITIPVDFHFVLALGLKSYIYSALGKINEKNDTVVEFGQEVDTILYLLRGRDDTSNYISVPDSQTLE